MTATHLDGVSDDAFGCDHILFTQLPPGSTGRRLRRGDEPGRAGQRGAAAAAAAAAAALDKRLHAQTALQRPRRTNAERQEDYYKVEASIHAEERHRVLPHHLGRARRRPESLHKCPELPDQKLASQSSAHGSQDHQRAGGGPIVGCVPGKARQRARVRKIAARARIHALAASAGVPKLGTSTPPGALPADPSVTLFNHINLQVIPVALRYSQALQRQPPPAVMWRRPQQASPDVAQAPACPTYFPEV